MLSQEDLRRLAAVSDPCLTIHQPLLAHQLRAGKPEAHVRASLTTAQKLLAEQGFSQPECDEMLHPLVNILENTDWTNRKGSFVMFRAPDFTLANFWPDALPPRVHFAQEFLILPLLPGLLSHRDFWLLAVGIKVVRLYRGSLYGLAEVAWPADVPQTLSAEEGFDRPDHTLRNRSGAGPSTGHMKGVTFGTSAYREHQADYLHSFFRAIDGGIAGILTKDQQPLILAGVTRELSLYRTANTYAPLLAGAVHGSPDSLGLDTLYAEASKLMSAYSAQSRDSARSVMEEAAGQRLIVRDSVEVIEAVRTGRVETLIVSADTAGSAQREEVVNRALIATIRDSGDVRLLNAAELPEGMAAVLRFGVREEADAEKAGQAAAPVHK